MIRTYEEATLLEMAEHATVPVINGLTNRTHPCQIMADVMTYEEHRGPITGKRVVWAGDGNNVCASFIHAAGQFGFDFTFTGPEPLDPEEKFMAFARAKGSKVVVERDPVRAVTGADLVVTDTWVSMHDPESAKERMTVEEEREFKKEYVRVKQEEKKHAKIILQQKRQAEYKVALLFQ
jgi:ornithine carbamoyltransferase